MTKAEKTRQYIIEKAAPIFNMHGYEGTSMSQLTEAIGLTKGALYGNFKNKDEIALAVLEYNISRISKEIAGKVKPIQNSCDKLIAYAEHYSEAYDTLLQRGGCPVLNAAVDSDNTDLPIRDVVVRWLDVWLGSVRSIIANGQKRNEINENVDPEEFATLFVSLIEGGIMLSKVMGSRSHLERNVRFLIDAINSELKNT